MFVVWTCMVFGGILILVALWRLIKKSEFGSPGAMVLVLGFLLCGASIFTQVKFEMGAEGFKIEVISESSKLLVGEVQKLADGLELLEGQLSALATQLEQRQALSVTEMTTFRSQIQSIPTIDRGRLQTMGFRLDSISRVLPGGGQVRPPGGSGG